MRGVNRPTPRQHSPHDHSGVRSAGYAGGAVARAAAVVAAVGGAALMAATPIMAQEPLTSGQSATAVSVAESDPMVFGLGLAGLFWLLAGLLALVAGVVLATRRVRKPAADGGAARLPMSTARSMSSSTSNDRAGGAEK